MPSFNKEQAVNRLIARRISFGLAFSVAIYGERPGNKDQSILARVATVSGLLSDNATGVVR